MPWSRRNSEPSARVPLRDALLRSPEAPDRLPQCGESFIAESILPSKGDVPPAPVPKPRPVMKPEPEEAVLRNW